jgi:hypothetical protein
MARRNNKYSNSIQKYLIYQQFESLARTQILKCGKKYTLISGGKHCTYMYLVKTLWMGSLLMRRETLRAEIAESISFLFVGKYRNDYKKSPK